MRKYILLILLGFSLIGFSMYYCNGSKSSQGISTETTGGEREICREHNVYEDECTRCDPALIPAFKAKGDWCYEHNVPLSQCTICNPSLADQILLPRESIWLAGIKTEEAKIRPLKTNIYATGKITYNEKKINPYNLSCFWKDRKSFCFFT